MSARVLVVDDEPGLREMLAVLFRREGYVPTTADGVLSALAKIDEEDPYDVVVTDLSMPDGSGMDVLNRAIQRDDGTQVIMITAYATTEQAVEAMRKGAYDYVQKPFRNNELRITVEKALEKKKIVRENRALREEVQRGVYLDESVVVKSSAMKRVMQLVQRVAAAPSNVLITGESGSGKEMIARSLHRASPRNEAPFIAINCGALPENLMESELFGHTKGAFTGATSDKDGLFRSAQGGSIFLDEVGELPLPLQVKLLRVLQDRKVRAVGSDVEHSIDVRVIAATNRDVERAVREGSFRQDLFYRLNVIRIHLPSLSQRPEDILPLAKHFLRKHGDLQGKTLEFSPEALSHVCRRSYPGNVRELENLIERAVTLALSEHVTLEEFPDAIAMSDLHPALPIGAPLPDSGFDLAAHLEDIEKRYLLQALEQSGGIRTNAAKLVGMSFRAFRYRLAKYQLADDLDDTEPIS